MSDEVLAPAITLLILVGLFLWVPALDLCKRRLHSRTRRTTQPASQSVPASRRGQAA